MITDEMAKKLIDLYRPTRICNPRRKYVKIIVDSLIEQLSNRYLGGTPRGIMNIRKQLNTVIDDYKGKDKKMLLAMKDILIKYNEVFTKSYVDYEDVYTEFIDNELRILVNILVKEKYFNNVKLATELGGII